MTTTTTTPRPGTGTEPPARQARRRSGATRLAAPSGLGVRIANTSILTVIAVLFVLPLAWLLLSSFDARATLTVHLPKEWTLDNFTAIATPEQTWRPLAVSAVLSFGSAAVALIAAVLASYPLSRYRMRFNKGFMYAVLFGTCLPITAMMVPVYSLFVRLNLLDSLPGVILFLGASSLPMAIWMTKNFVDSVPIALEEAAWTDGASAMRTLWSIVIPLMRPGMAVVFIFVFIGAWGNFFVPFALLLNPDTQPASVSIVAFFGQYGAVAYGQLAAYSLLYSVPVVVLYVVVSRLSGSSFAMAGAVKG